MTTYKRGDFVWLFCQQKYKGLCPKLQKAWAGPYLVVHKLSDALYRVQKSPRTKPKVVHFNRLKLCHSKELRSWVTEEEPQVKVEVVESSTEPQYQQNMQDEESDSEEEINNVKTSRENGASAGVTPEEISSFPKDSTLEEESHKQPNCNNTQTFPPAHFHQNLRCSKRTIHRPRRLIEEI